MSVNINRNKMVVCLSWTAVILWMLVIFMFSAQAASQSNGLSTGITEAFIRNILGAIPGYEFDILWINYLIRKLAHFMTYMVLGVLASNALRTSGVRGKQTFIAALMICILYAASDELHQLFVPGRGGRLMDVLIDSSGAAVGIACLMFIRK